MDKGLKAKWVMALRSGKYTQTTKTLRTEQGFCCLGVLLDLSGMGEWDGSVYRYTDDGGERCDATGDLCELSEHLNIGVTHEARLVDMNDGNEKTKERRHSFSEIADWIEANL